MPILFLLFAALFLLVIPVGEAPDEAGHLAYVTRLLQGRPPHPETERGPLYHHPPLYYAAAAGAVRLLGYDPAAAPPQPRQTLLPFPLYRVSVATWGDGRLHPAYVARAVSLLFGLLFLAALARGLRLLFPADRPARRVAFSLALLPGPVFAAATATNDLPAAATATLAYTLSFAALTGHFLTRPAHPVLFALALAAAALTKASGLLPLLLLPLLLCLRPALVRPLALTFGLTLLLLGVTLFYPANLLNLADPTLTAYAGRARPDLVRPFPVTEAYLGHVCARLVRGFFGELGRQEIQLARPLLLLLLAVSGAAAGGLLRRPLGLPARTALFALAVLAATFLALLLWNLRFYGPYGRYLYPAFLPAAALYAAGLRRLLGSRFRPLALPLAVLPPFATVYTLFGSVLPHYYAPRAKWERGEVLFYDDAGHPRLEPHRVRQGAGGDYEPWGTYSTARVPEMNVAWGYPDLLFRYPPLEGPLQVRFTLYGGGEPGKFGFVPYQCAFAGPLPLHGPLPLTFRPRELTYYVSPEALAADRSLTLRFHRLRGEAAAVAEVWVERPWLALAEATLRPLAGGRLQVTLRLRNRDPTAPHPFELFLRAGPTTLLHRVAPSPLPAGGMWTGGLVAPRPAEEAPLFLGLRRLDRGPWALLKGATYPGPAATKRGDLAARDLHVAWQTRGGPVFAATLRDLPPGPYRLHVRYRARRPGEARLAQARAPLPATGATYRTHPLLLRPRGRPDSLTLHFPAGARAAVDEVWLWAEGNPRTIRWVRLPLRP